MKISCCIRMMQHLLVERECWLLMLDLRKSFLASLKSKLFSQNQTSLIHIQMLLNRNFVSFAPLLLFSGKSFCTDQLLFYTAMHYWLCKVKGNKKTCWYKYMYQYTIRNWWHFSLLSKYKQSSHKFFPL